MSDLDKKRLEIKLILENQNIKPGTDSSIKRVKAVLNKIKTSVQNDKEATEFLADISQTNFEKYLDEVATVFATELLPKKPVTIMSFVYVLAVLDVSYPGFFKLYYNKWLNSQFEAISQSLKKNPDSVDKHSIRLIFESYLVGYDIFLQSINAIISLIMQSPITCSLLTFTVYLSKVVAKFDKNAFSFRADLWRIFNSFATQFSENVKHKLNILLKGITLQSQKNQIILEARGALSMDQSTSFLSQLNDFQALLSKYSEFCNINNITFVADDWKIDQPLTENGRVVFVDNSVSNDEIVASFSSREEYNYYCELNIDSVVVDGFSDIDKFVDYFKHMQSYLHVDALAKFFLTSSPTLNSQDDFTNSLIEVSKTRYDLIPAIARFFALIRSQHPAISDLAAHSIFCQSMNFIHKRSTNVGLKNRMAFFVSEFVKFSLLVHSSIFNLLKKCADNLDSFNFEFTVQVLHGCGKFLYFQPATRKRIENIFRLLKKNYSRLLPSEYGSLESAIQIILGCEGIANVELESTESIYISFLLAKITFNPDVAHELVFVSHVLGVSFVVESLLNSRSLCYIPLMNICLFLSLIKKSSYYEAIDLLLLYTSYEIERFPFVDKQFVLKCVEIIFNETSLNRLKVKECISALSSLTKKDSNSPQDNEWLEFIVWYNKACRKAALSCGVGISDADFATAYDEHQEDLNSLESKQLHPRDCDNIDISMDEYIAKMSTIAIEEKKTSLKSRDEPLSYLGSPRKSGESEKFILLRAKGKKGNDFRKVV